MALGVVYFVIWLGLGSLWMKLIGLMRETVNSVLYSFIFISSLVNTIEQIKTFTYISFLLPNILIRIIIYKNIIL